MPQIPLKQLVLSLVSLGPANKAASVPIVLANDQGPIATAGGVGALADGATTSGALTGLVSVGSRAAEPNSLGQWYAQNQSASVMFLVFYAADGTTRLATIAIDPGAGQGRQGGDSSWAATFGAFKGPMTLFGTSGAQATLTRQ